MDVFLLLLALVGHGFLWVGLINRLHSLKMRRSTLHRITYALFGCAGLVGAGIAWCYVGDPARFSVTHPTAAAEGTWAELLIGAYLLVCWVLAPLTLARFLGLRLFRRPAPLLRLERRQPVEIDLASAAASAAELAHHPLVRLPGNEILQLELVRWVLDVPRMPAALDGLSIVHFADLHMTGRVGKAYFRELVRFCNGLRPDLVCITGDIIDDAACLDWLADTLAYLEARHGVYFVLGNHDCRLDVGLVRRTLGEAGLIDVGGRWLSVTIGGTPVVLAGNERPWIATVADLSDCPPPAPAGPLRIVLAHSPDQFGWARAQEADLLLVGHTHGGQICLPPLGAIFSPSAKGVKYVSGVHYAAPTILHVTRGVSADVPIRWNCRPEIAHLCLRAGSGTSP
jgi:predicted MPP superfamily phosphohydrolase